MAGKLRGLMVVAGIGLLTLPVAAQQPAAQAPQASGPDQELVTRLRQLGLDEIAAARMGQTRATRPNVQGFAERMERDHRAADDRLLAYATRKNMNRADVSAPGGALEHSTLALAPLANSTQSEFDYNFVAKMVADHQAAIDAATAAERLARDPELRSMIDADLKMMTEHLVVAQQLQAAIPAPAPRVVGLPAYPAGVSRTQTGADIPPPAARVR
jgi:putative membrane protein